MILKNIICIALVFSVFCLFSGCATYSPGAVPFGGLDHHLIKKEDSGVSVSVRFLDNKEIRSIFKRNLREKFVLPVYVEIVNNSINTYQFEKKLIDKSVFTANQAADQGQFSVFWRVLPFSPFMVSIFLWPLVIPALVGGFGAVKANRLMRADYVEKEINDRGFAAGERGAGFLYFDQRTLGNSFVVQLKNLESGQMLKFEFVKGN
jgi:hypothetical protein